jgi:hypothetical protein
MQKLTYFRSKEIWRSEVKLEMVTNFVFFFAFSLDNRYRKRTVPALEFCDTTNVVFLAPGKVLVPIRGFCPELGGFFW